MKPGPSGRSGIGADSGEVWLPAILAGRVSGAGHLGGIVVAFQHATGAACLPAYGRLCPARTVPAPAKTGSPW
jgi:hypothetical protein